MTTFTVQESNHLTSIIRLYTRSRDEFESAPLPDNFNTVDEALADGIRHLRSDHNVESVMVVREEIIATITRGD